jgi:arsenate reductase (thioredoxin)
MTKILFLCPHNAAKSVLAAAYAKKLAKEKGLELAVDTAGTEPSEQVSPVVAEFLKQEGMDFLTKPRKVTHEDIASATRIISMGCALEELPLQGETVEQWDDVPPVSQDLPTSWEQIKEKVDALLAGLGHECVSF